MYEERIRKESIIFKKSNVHLLGSQVSMTQSEPPLPTLSFFSMHRDQTFRASRTSGGGCVYSAKR